MKICAGLGRVDDYPLFARAGADEVFCGYVPAAWYDKYDVVWPVNRREVRYAHVQLGSRSELKILASMVRDFGVPVSLTFNSLSYLPSQYAQLARILDDCIQDGFSRFILADPGLLGYLHARNFFPECQITVSGELGEMNPPLARKLAAMGVTRLIFHRKMGFEDMQTCIHALQGYGMEFEAFAMNEKCHFHGAFCNSLHCDELPSLCNLPYRCIGMEEEAVYPDPPQSDSVCPGSSGCGLCALYDLRQMGITHLKLVGRGNLTDSMLCDLKLLRACRDAAETVKDSAAYLAFVRAQFPDGCSGNCYY